MIVADGVKGPSHKISFIEMTSMHRASEYTFCFLAFFDIPDSKYLHTKMVI
jgi:hypothetical protein